MIPSMLREHANARALALQDARAWSRFLKFNVTCSCCIEMQLHNQTLDTDSRSQHFLLV